MFNVEFYHGLMKKYVVYFGSLFNDITISREDQNGDVIQQLAVPISYGPKHKFIARLEQDPDLNRETAITVPRLSFEIAGLTYDPARKFPTMNRIVKQSGTSDSRGDSIYTPVPYNINFNLSIYAKNVEDILKIMEQILPFFTPEWTSTLDLVPSMGISVDIPVILNNVSMSDQYESSYESINRRYIVHTLSFTMKSYFYGPLQPSKGLIKRVIVNMHNTKNLKVTKLNVQSFISKFEVGNYVYQHDGKTRNASGVVEFANSTYLTLKEVYGNFSTANNILSTNSNAIAIVTSIDTAEQPDERITIRPTMFANGAPTSNLSDSVDIDSISATDNYGININITDL